MCALIDKLDKLHIAIQTCGYADKNIYEKVIEKVDFVMQDIKIIDSA